MAGRIYTVRKSRATRIYGTGRKGGIFGRTDCIKPIIVGVVELEIGLRIADKIDII